MLNVICVLKTGSGARGLSYTTDWVDRLYHGVRRNLDIDFDFICFSDVPTRYTTIPLISDSSGYWNKIEIFRPGIFDGPALYLDLDTVICKNITEDIMKLPDGKFLMIKEPYRDIHNSSMMFWNGDYSYLYDNYLANKDAIVNEYQYNLSRKGWLGDQAYIGENVSHGLVEDYISPGVIGWKHHKINTVIDDPSILIFTGSEKPCNNLEHELVRKNWI